MLKAQQDRGGIPRYLNLMIANKGGAVDAARNDVGIVYAKNGPIIISAFLSTTKEVNWTWDNPGQLMIGRSPKQLSTPGNSTLRIQHFDLAAWCIAFHVARAAGVQREHL